MMSLLWSEHAQNDEDTDQSVVSIPGEGGGGERGGEREEIERYIIPYNRKYWRELHLVVEPKIAIARILADLNFGGSVRDRHMYI